MNNAERFDLLVGFLTAGQQKILAGEIEQVRSALTSKSEELGSAQRLDDGLSGLPQPRPNIGEPGFEWQVGMVCETRGGGFAKIIHTCPTDEHLVVSANQPDGYKGSWHDINGLWDLCGEPDDYDLIRVIEWPDGYRLDRSPDGAGS